MRAAGASAVMVLVGLLAACGSPAATHSSPAAALDAGSTRVTDVPCPTDARRVPKPETAPPDATISELMLCQVALVDRGSLGWWLRLSRSIASRGISPYLKALRAPDSTASVGCPAAGWPTSPPLPQLAVDATGAMQRLRIPAGFCGGPQSATVTAAAKLHWQAAGSRWLTRMLPARLGVARCAAFLERSLSWYWPLGGPSEGLYAGSPYLSAVQYRRDGVCAVRAPAATGPVPADVVVGSPISRGAMKAAAARALDAHPGITGPDPIGRLMDPSGSMPRPQPCSTPTQHPYLLETGDGVLGYADLGPCLKAVSTSSHLTTAAMLVTVVEEMQSDPYQT